MVNSRFERRKGDDATNDANVHAEQHASKACLGAKDVNTNLLNLDKVHTEQATKKTRQL